MSYYSGLLKGDRDEAFEMVAVIAARKAEKDAADRLERARIDVTMTKTVIKGQYKYKRRDPEPPKPVKATPKPEGWGEFA